MEERAVKMATTLVLLSALPVCCAHPRPSDCRDAYHRLHSQLLTRDSEEEAERKLAKLRSGLVLDPRSNSARRRLLTAAERIGVAQSSIKLELVNGNLFRYRACWLIETEKEIVRLDCADRHHCAQSAIASDTYERIWQALEQAGVWDLETDADRDIDDGDLIFISVSRDGRTWEAATYGVLLPSGEFTGTRHDVPRSAAEFTRVLGVLSLCGH